MPVMGMNSALIAIVGYNFGAQKKQRIYQATRYSLIAAVMIMALGTLIFQAFPQALLGMFNASARCLDMRHSGAQDDLVVVCVCRGVDRAVLNLPGAGRRHAFAVGVAGPSADPGAAAGLAAFNLGRAERAVAGICAL